MKRNGAMAVLLMLVYFIVYPLLTMIEIRNWEQWYDNGQDWIVQTVREILAYSPATLFFTVCFAVILGILQFAYLHNREKLDFYHSFPVRREELFAIQYVSGVVTWAVPYGLNLLLALLMTSVKGYVDSFSVMQIVKGMAVQMICFLVIYSFMILAMMMTGKIFTAILGMGVFMVYVPLICVLGISMATEYFTSYVSPDLGKTSCLLFSPIYACVMALERFTSPELNSKDLLLGILICAALTTGISVLLYRQRSTESAGRSMAFCRTARLIKFGLVIAAAIASQLIFFAIGNNMAWSIFGLLFGFVLSSALVEFIYRLDIREVFADRKQILGTLLVVMGISVFFQFDLAGFDKKLPDKSKVEYVTMNSMGQPDYGLNAGLVQHFYLLTTGNDEFVYQSAGYQSKEEVPITNIDAVYQLLEQRRSRKKVLADDVSRDYRVLNNICFTFYMKDGSEVMRRYEFEETDYWAAFEEIWSDQAYREQSLPVFTVGVDKMLDITVGTGYYYEGSISVEKGDLSLVMDMENLPDQVTKISAEALTSDEFTMTREEKEKLYQVMAEEILGMTAAEIQQEYEKEYIAMVNIVYVDQENQVYGESFRITEGHKKTAALLKEFGYNTI